MLDLLSDPAVFSCLSGVLLLMIAVLLALPALTAALGLMRLERSFGKLFWHFVTALYRRDRTRTLRKALRSQARCVKRMSAIR